MSRDERLRSGHVPQSETVPRLRSFETHAPQGHALRDEDDFADVGARFEAGVGVGGAVERIDGIDNRDDRIALGQ